MDIKFADMTEERKGSVMGCESTVITMTPIRLGYLVHIFCNCAITLFTKTHLRANEMRSQPTTNTTISHSPMQEVHVQTIDEMAQIQ